MGRLGSILIIALLLAPTTLLPVRALAPAGHGQAPGATYDGLMDGCQPPGRIAPLDQETIAQIGSAPGCFIENRGQIDDPDVRFYAPGSPVSVGLAPGVVIYSIQGDGGAGDGPSQDLDEGMPGTVIRVKFVACNPVAPRGEKALGHRTNYFIGNDSSRWVRGARSFPEVVYEGIYDGIDLRFYFKDGYLKYEFALDVGANPDSILLRYDGASGLRMDPLTGDLLIGYGPCNLRDSRPVMLQDVARASRAEPGRFRVIDGSTVGFSIPDCFDRGLPITIDPGLLFSTYLGGSDVDPAYTLALDPEGDIIVAGHTHSMDFPTTAGGIHDTPSDSRFFLTELDPTCSRVLFSTFIGGKTGSCGPEGVPTAPSSITVRPDGSIVIVGNTRMQDYPTTDDAYNRYNAGSYDIFITVVDDNASRILYSTFLGGSRGEAAPYCIFDDEGSMYLTGHTESMDFPTSEDAFCRTFRGGYSDAIMVKLDHTLRNVTYSTLVGGYEREQVFSCAVDEQKNLYLAGSTASTDFPITEGAYQAIMTSALAEVFVIKLDPTGSNLVFSTFLGGSRCDFGGNVYLSSDGSVYVTGCTESEDFPIVNSTASRTGTDYDSFIALLSADGHELLFSTRLGGGGMESEASASAMSADGDALYLLGTTKSTDLPTTPGCYNPHRSTDPDDVYVMVFDLTEMKLTYCTYLGGQDYDTLEYGSILAVGDNGTLAFTVLTTSPDFPVTARAFSRTFNGGFSDTAVVVFDPRPCDVPTRPTGLRTASGDGTVEVSWDASTEENYMTLRQVLYRGGEEGSLAPVAELDPRAPSYIDTNGSTGQRFLYALARVNSAGEGPISEPVPGIFLEPPEVPMNLTAATGDGTVILSWEPPIETGGEVLGYNLMRGEDPYDISPIETNLTSSAYVDANVSVGTTYYYSVAAYNHRGTGPMTGMVCITPTAPPLAPRDLRVTPGDRRVELSWSAPISDGGSPVTGYRVYRGGSSSAMAPLALLNRDATSYVDVDVETGHRYYYRVAAVSDLGEGRPSDTLSSVPYCLPTAPRDAASVPGDGYVNLTWSPPLDEGGCPVTGYLIYSGSSPVNLAFSCRVGNVTSHCFKSLTNGLTYYFEVSAITEAGEGPKSALLQAMPLGPPGAPKQFSIAMSPDGVKLDWYPPDDWGGAKSLTFEILRGLSPSALEPLALATDARTFTDVSVVGRTTYYYAVRATNMASKGPLSPIKEVSVMTVPGPVVNLTAVVGDGLVRLSWLAPLDDGGSPILKYKVVRGCTDGSPQVSRTLGVDLAFLDTDVVNLKSYYYSVQAMNLIGTGPASSTVNATPIGLPGIPEDLAWRIRGHDILLTWAASGKYGSAPATSYMILRGRSPEDLEVIAEVGPALTYTDPDVEQGRRYYYTVIANSTVGQGPPAPVITVGTESMARAAWARFAIPIVAGALLVGIIGLAYGRSRRRASREGTGKGEVAVDRRADVTSSAVVSVPVIGGANVRMGCTVRKVFVVFRDGRLIADVPREEGRTRDAELMSAMLVAVQSAIREGLERGGLLERVEYGDDLILLANGKNIIIAAFVNGRPDGALSDDLAAAVRRVEGSYAGVIEKWAGDRSLLSGIDAMVSGLLSPRRPPAGVGGPKAPPSPGVSLSSEVDYFRGYVRLIVTVSNGTPEQISEAALEVRYDSDLLTLETIVPSSMKLWGDRITIGMIRAGSAKAVTVLFEPQACQTSYIDGALNYYDSKGEFRAIDMARCRAEIVCPTFLPQEQANTAMLRRLVKERLRTNDFRRFRYTSGLPPDGIFKHIERVITGMDVQLVREFVESGPSFMGEAWFYGVTKPEGHPMVMRMGVLGKERLIELFIASTAMRPISGFVTEFRKVLADLFREEPPRAMHAGLGGEDDLGLGTGAPIDFLDRDPDETGAQGRSGSEGLPPPPVG